MFGRTTGRLQAAVDDLQKQVADLRVTVAQLDPAQLETLRNQVVNAIRSLRRLDASRKPEPDSGEGPDESTLPTWARRRA